jgi:putative hydrolase of the HAD superfamily
MLLRKPIDQYKAVFFDVGDTLLTIPAARIILREYLAGHELHRDEEAIGELFTESFRLFYYGKPLDAFEACSPESDRAFWMKLYRYILEKLGVQEERWTEEKIHECCHELYDLFTSPQHYALFEDVLECLEGMKQKGLRLGVISNFAPTLASILEDKGIREYFDPVIVSTEVGLEKPDPAIFTLALEKAGLSAHEVLYVGDHERNDIWAPAQIGMDAVRIKRYEYMTGDGIASLKELIKE